MDVRDEIVVQVVVGKKNRSLLMIFCFVVVGKLALEIQIGAGDDKFINTMILLVDINNNSNISNVMGI